MATPTDRPLSFYAQFLSLPGTVPPGGHGRTSPSSSPRTITPPSSPSRSSSEESLTSESSRGSASTLQSTPAEPPHAISQLIRRVNRTPLPPDHMMDAYATRTKMRHTFSWDCLRTMCNDRGLATGSKDECIDHLLEWRQKRLREEPELADDNNTSSDDTDSTRFAPADEVPAPDDLLLETPKSVMLSTYSRPQLQQMCRDRGVPARGSKGDLAQALFQWRQREKIRVKRDSKRKTKEESEQSPKRRRSSRKDTISRARSLDVPKSGKTNGNTDEFFSEEFLTGLSRSALQQLCRTHGLKDADSNRKLVKRLCKTKITSTPIVKSPAQVPVPSRERSRTPRRRKSEVKEEASASSSKGEPASESEEEVTELLDGFGVYRLEHEFSRDELHQLCRDRDLQAVGSKKVMATNLYLWKLREKRRRSRDL